MDNQKDNKLIKKIAMQDIDAFNEIYSRFSQVVYNISYKILANKNDAEETVQEVFVQIWNKSSNYQQQRGAVSTWIMNIARSRAIDKYRSLKNMKKITYVENDVLEFIAPKSFIVEDKTERRNIIKKALDLIPKEQKEVINTIYFKGATHIETSEILNIPVGTVKTRLRLGMLKLRELISPYIEKERNE